MELPHLGEHCSEKSCRKLDFLPIKCDSCHLVFCCDHYNYSAHNCASGPRQPDIQVPVCPLCEKPVTGFKRGDPPDIAVSQHIDNQCRNSKKEVYTNKCSLKGCKVKEVIQIKCSQCGRNYCLKHRHTQDHQCVPKGVANNPRQENRRRETEEKERQMREDEMLARALQASLNEQRSAPPSTSNSSRNLRSPFSASSAVSPVRETVDQPSCAIS